MKTVFHQYDFNVSRSPFFTSLADLPQTTPQSPAVRFIAYYLPQFHPIPENDAWWGAGFTEWTNVSKALPRYVGHRQPRMPGDLGFYDLRDAGTLRRQAELASRGGVYGFCIHDYWFSGRKILETPLNLLLANPDIELPFCLNWANENWSRRWDGSENDILLKQLYNREDAEGYIRSILPALRDPRYIRVRGRPLIMLYRPRLLPDAPRWLEKWRQILVAEKIGDPYLVMPQSFGDIDPRVFGFDAAAGFPPHHAGWDMPNEKSRLDLLDLSFEGRAASYAGLARRSLSNWTEAFRLLPGVCPEWDSEARHPGRGTSFYGASPAAYSEWLEAAASQALRAEEPDERIVFINAWNEWAEGAHLEPDRHHGHALLAQTRRVLDKISSTPRDVTIASSSEPLSLMPPSSRHRFASRLLDLASRLARRADVR